LHSFGVGLLLRRAGYVGNAADPQTSLDACVDAMRDGTTLVMFPKAAAPFLEFKPDYAAGQRMWRSRHRRN